MCHMYSFHQQVIITYNCFTFGCCTAIDSYILTNDIVITNFGCGFFTTKLEILWDSTNHSTRKNGISVADARTV